MTKKNTSKKNTSKKCELVPGSTSFETNIKFDERHVVSVGVAEREAALQEEEKRAKADIKKLQKKAKEIQGSLEDETPKHAKTVLKEFNKAVKALNTLQGGEFKASVKRVSKEKEGLVVFVAIESSGENYRYNQGLNFQRTLEPSQRMESLSAELAVVHKACSEMTDYVFKIAESLATIDSYERKLQAAVAKKLLEQTDEGRMLLDSIEGFDAFPADIQRPALPNFGK